MRQDKSERTLFTSRLKGGLDGFAKSGREAGKYLRRYAAVLAGPEQPLLKRAGYAAGGALAVTAVMAHFLMVMLVLLIPFTPGLKSLKAAKIDNPSIVLSADGEEIVRYHRINRKWVDLEEMAPVVTDALVATEDKRFYGHNGIDATRMVSSVLHTLMGDTEGGSTLPMQMARNLYPKEIGQEFGPFRKLKEMVTAIKIEAVYSKEEILETYLNTVPFLYNTNGIEMAAQTYFGKPAAELDTLEAATLVGMLKGTAYYNPARNPERAQARRNIVLHLMARHGALPEEKLEALQAQPVSLQFHPQSVLQSRAPHFTAHLKGWLQGWAEDNGYDLYADGLRIQTTLDMGLQDMAQAAMTRQLDALQTVADVEWGRSPYRLVSTQTSAYGPAREQVKPFDYFWQRNPDLLEEEVRRTERFREGVQGGASEPEMLTRLAEDAAFMDSVKAKASRVEGGFVAIDPQTGYVRAWVGSRDFFKDQYDHVARAKRQPGSTFKPFVYATALESGYGPNDVFWDREVAIRMEGGGVWRPTNSGGSTGEPMTLRSALAQSKNTITAQVMERVGPARVAETAHKMGIGSDLDEVPSLALGTSDVSLLEMVSAYGTIAGQGTHHTPVLVTRIEDNEGNVLARFATETEEALTRTSALHLLDMMRGVVDEGTAQGLRWRFKVDGDLAGKTGTTQENADGWFILMHPNLVAGSWVGFNDRRIAFRSNYWGQGAHNALFVVGDFFEQAMASGAVDQAATFPAAPASGRGEYHDSFLDRLGGWITERINSAVKARPLEAPDGTAVESEERDRDADRRAERRADQMRERERRKQEIAEERARKMREHSQERRQRESRERDRRDGEAEGERRGW